MRNNQQKNKLKIEKLIDLNFIFFNLDEEKLDKLPPVPPSTWSANSSMRRRNPYYQQSPYMANNRLKKYINKSQNGVDLNENASYNTNSNEERPEESENYNYSNKSNGINYELSIQESSVRNFDQEDPQTHLKNYDNVNNSYREENSSNGYGSFNNNKTNTNNNNIDEDEKVEITLNKDSRSKDFGFTIADSVFGQGIYVNKIKNGISMENMKPFTKIFKVSFKLS